MIEIKKSHAATYLTFLTWQDVLEKLDTIILEIRHLQVSIIHSLREPDLYRNLRYEESYLWGGESSKAYQSTEIDFIEQAILLYPTADEFTNETNPAQKKINNRISEIWFQHSWGREQKRHYYFLHGLQLLKRDIFKNKITLCQFAFKIKLHLHIENKGHINGDDRAKFIILRGGILNKSKDYINHLKNYQNAFSKDLDIGEQNHPRPSLERRRELGVYMDFLADRTKNIHRDMIFFLNAFDINIQPFRQNTLIFHRWKHGMSSETSYMDNETEETLMLHHKNPDNDRLPTSIHFVTTSYFMPERPDLQPIIAHEVGHAVVRDYFDNYDPTGLGKGEDDFSILLTNLQYTIARFEQDFQLPNATEIKLRDFMQELTCDLLALSVKGLCYLYAFFIETISFDMERFLEGYQGKIDLNIINELETIPLRRILNWDWYIRYQVMITWIKKIHHHELCHLDQLLLKGIEQLISDIDGLLYNKIPDPEKNNILLWQKLTKQLVKIIDESPATSVAKEWRNQRCNDSEQEDGDKKDCMRQYPRSMMRLDKHVRTELYSLQLKMKTAEDRPLRGYKHLIDKLDIIEYYYDPINITTLNLAQKLEGKFKLIKVLIKDSQSKLTKNLNLKLYKSELDDKFNSLSILNQQQRNNEYFTQLIIEIEKKLNILTLEVERELDYSLGQYQVKLKKDIKKLHQKFKKFYGVIYKKDNNFYPLYRHLYDIPWQSSLMRAMDVLQYEEPKEFTALEFKAFFLQQMHFSFPLGRELFEIALEFYLWKTETAIFRLGNIHHLIKNIIDLNYTYPEGKEIKRHLIFNKLQQWLTEQNNQQLDDIADKLDKLIKKNKFKNQRICDDTLKKILPWDGDNALSVSNLLKLHSRIPKLKSHQKRLIERAAGYKIETLCIYLEKTFNLPSILKPLLLYMQANTTKKEDFYTKLLTSFRKNTAHSKDKQGHQHWMIARLSITGENPIIPDTKNIYNIKHLCPSKPLKILRQSMLGRYDMVTLSKTRPLCRCPLPSFHEDINGNIEQVLNEKFSSFFIRREFARYASLHGTSTEWFNVDNNQKITAYLVITLQHRLYRLGFLYRLIEAIEKNQKEEDIIENIGGHFSKLDFCFLTDGWGDLIICFADTLGINNKVKLSNKRIKNIFTIQNAIYQDFMVDRTELIFSPSVANHIIKNNVKSYAIKVQVRMIEDRKLALSNKNFIYDIQKNKQQCEKNNSFFKHLNIFKIPGRMDFILTFKGDVDQEEKDKDFYPTLLELLESDYIRTVDTSICNEWDLITGKPKI